MPTDDNPNNAGKEALRLKHLRAHLGLSQRQMAEKFKVRHGAISQWEAGKRSIPGPILALMEIYEKELAEGKLKKQSALKKIPTNYLKRTFGTSRAALQIAKHTRTNTLGTLLKDIEENQRKKSEAEQALARSLVTQLGQFKGLVMKVGQLLSYTDFVLSDSARDLLADLQDDSQQMDEKLVRKIIEQELGKTPEELFASWDPDARAASIGQVHRAKLSDGTPVAVKVQYPGIAKAIKADLANTALIELFVTIAYRHKSRGTLLKELRDRILEECDYRKEAENQKRFVELYKDVPGISIPKVFDDYCTKKVFTSEYAEGVPFHEFLEDADQDARNFAATQLFRFAYESIYRHRVFNGDPHPGNYFFSQDKVTFIDFGCTKKFTKQFITDWKTLGRAAIEKNTKKIDEMMLKMGIVSDPNSFDFDYQREVVMIYYTPALSKQPFRFTPDFVEKFWRTYITDNPNRFNMNFPGDWLFTNRLQWGLFSVLAAMKAEIPCKEMILEYLYED